MKTKIPENLDVTLIPKAWALLHLKPEFREAASKILGYENYWTSINHRPLDLNATATLFYANSKLTEKCLYYWGELTGEGPHWIKMQDEWAARENDHEA